MRVMMFSKTPLAAAPLEIWKAVRKYTNIECRLIQCSDRYLDGRTFPHDVIWKGGYNADVEKIARGADVWHVHNYYMPELFKWWEGQPVVAQFHSVPRMGSWQALMNAATVSYCVDQPMQMREYGLTGLPNLIDPDEYRPALRSSKDWTPKIVFAPTSRAMSGPMSKGYYDVIKVLRWLASSRTVNVSVVEGVPYIENLRMKSDADIIIDDVVNKTFHRTTLEACCFGAAPINNSSLIPFVPANLDTLAGRLIELLSDVRLLRSTQHECRLWVLKRWHPADLVKSYVRAYSAALNASYNPSKNASHACRSTISPFPSPSPIPAVPDATGVKSNEL